MTSNGFRQVDVFGKVPLAGNPVAVVLGADDLSDDQMRRFSVWTNLSECTFLLRPTHPDADYRVRIFSLTTELPFAGHPTLGTARAWLDAGGQPARSGTIVQECGAGLIDVRVSDDTLAFLAPPLTRFEPPTQETLNAALQVLGVTPADVIAASWIDNGPGWLGVLLATSDAVLALRPDVSAHPQHWDIGVAGLTEPGAPTQLEVRAFFTEDGTALREDPVTGSLNAAFAQWLSASGNIALPYTASQGSAIGRDGRVHLSSVGEEIWVGGTADVVIRGDVDIPITTATSF